MDAGPAWIYLGLLGLIWGAYGWRRSRQDRHSRAARDAAARAGLLEPHSLHPVIDPARCLGCGACVSACPEAGVLGLIDTRAELVEPTRCIGHGACRESCPTHAIELVFGTATRGVEIPLVGRDFQTNVPGIFIAGELGGMGLIRNAVEQGRQAMEAIRARNGRASDGALDVLIAGAGPAGLSASLAALQHGLRFVTVEQDALGGCVAHYPRAKLVMTEPAELPLVGKVRFRETTREALLDFWHDVERRTGLEIRYGERLDHVRQDAGIFEVSTSRSTYRVRNILLAIGRRGSPRKLGVSGEELPKVVYSLSDPEQYRGQRVLVVGGGDSALEAAATLADGIAAEVTLSYRGSGFSRARPANRTRIEQAAAAGVLRVLLESQVEKVASTEVVLTHAGKCLSIANDAVIVCAGGILPITLLESIGVRVETKHGTA